MDAVVAALPFGQQTDHSIRDPADAGLQRRAVRDERADVPRDGALNVARLAVGQLERRAVHLDQHVDVRLLDPVRGVRRHTERARQTRIDLHDERPVRVPPTAEELVHGRTRVQREAASSLLVGRCRSRGHHARTHALTDGGEAPEIGRHEVNIATALGEVALDRTEESTEQSYARPLEEREAAEQQRRVDLETVERIALAEGLEKRGRLSGAERQSERVVRTHESRSFERSTDPHDGVSTRRGSLDQAPGELDAGNAAGSILASIRRIATRSCTDGLPGPARR